MKKPHEPVWWAVGSEGDRDPMGWVVALVAVAILLAALLGWV